MKEYKIYTDMHELTVGSNVELCENDVVNLGENSLFLKRREEDGSFYAVLIGNFISGTIR